MRTTRAKPATLADTRKPGSRMTPFRARQTRNRASLEIRIHCGDDGRVSNRRHRYQLLGITALFEQT